MDEDSSSTADDSIQLDVDNILDLAYETQYFGFHPRSFTDGVYGTILDYLFDGLHEMGAYLTKKYTHLMQRELLEQKTESLFNELTRKLNKAIDKLELYLNRNVFKIPENVVLPEDHIHFARPTTDKQMEELDAEIAELLSKVKKSRERNGYLKEKYKEQQVIMDNLQSFNKIIDLPQSAASEIGIPDIVESVKFSLEKASELTQALKTLR